MADQDRSTPAVALVVRRGEELRVSGRLDAASAADVRLVLHAALDEGEGDLVLDLAEAELADATGLGLLVGAHRRAGRTERRLVLAHVPPPIDRLLAVTRLHRVLTVQDRLGAPAA